MTRVDAPTAVVAGLEDGLSIVGVGEITAKCNAWPFIDIAEAHVRTVSQLKGVSILVNVTLNLNLVTSTFKSAHVDSLHTTFSDVDTSCSVDSTIGGLDGFCSA